MGIVELLKWVWDQFETYILPFTIIHIYERGVRLTFGKKPQIIEPGFVWKIPFIQVILTDTITPNTMCPNSIHTTTADGKTISIEPAIEYEITDIVKWIVWTNSAETNLRDIVRGVVSDYVTDATWELVKDKKSQTEIKKKLNSRCEDMGCKVTKVMLTDMCISRIIITQI